MKEMQRIAPKGAVFLKKATIAAVCAAFCTVTFCGTFSGYVSGARIRQGTKTAAETHLPKKTSSAPISPKMSDNYTVGEISGKLTLFRKTEDGIPLVWESYDSDTSALPKADREELSVGIDASSIEEALQIIEDFIS